MTQQEIRDVSALAQRFDDFIGMYRDDRKMNAETHDAVVALKTDAENTKETVKKNCEDIEELKSQPGKQWSGAKTALIAAIIAGIVGVVIGALSKLIG
jgi:uncharacterized protein YcfJ